MVVVAALLLLLVPSFKVLLLVFVVVPVHVVSCVFTTQGPAKPSQPSHKNRSRTNTNQCNTTTKSQTPMRHRRQRPKSALEKFLRTSPEAVLQASAAKQWTPMVPRLIPRIKMYIRRARHKKKRPDGNASSLQVQIISKNVVGGFGRGICCAPEKTKCFQWGRERPSSVFAEGRGWVLIT